MSVLGRHKGQSSKLHRDEDPRVTTTPGIKLIAELILCTQIRWSRDFIHCDLHVSKTKSNAVPLTHISEKAQVK